MQKFEIIYEIKGTRKVNVTVPSMHKIPDDWSTLSTVEKDAWIYDHQSSSEVVFEDIHHAEAESVDWLD